MCPLLGIYHIEVVLQKTHEYFCKSPKCHLKFTKLVEIMETKGKKILKHVKTRWCSLLLPLHRILSEYRTLVVKMALDEDRKSHAKAFLDSLFDSALASISKHVMYTSMISWQLGDNVSQGFSVCTVHD